MKKNKNTKFHFSCLNVLRIITLTLLIGISFSGCAFGDFLSKEIKGEFVGNEFTVSLWDNNGNHIMSIDADKVGMHSNANPNEQSYSVIINTIDGQNMTQSGNTVIYAEKGLVPVKEFDLPENITSQGGNANIIDRDITHFKNMVGAPKTVIISSQLGVPIAIYQGDSVYYKPCGNNLPKTTLINIDGKALYIHRANYIIIDTSLITNEKIKKGDFTYE